MKRSLFVLGILLFALIMFSQCTTRYQLGQKYINKGQSYHAREKYTKSLKEFSKALKATGTKPDSYKLKYLLAVIYHRLYVINVDKHWADLDPNDRNRFEFLAKVLDQASTQKTDLLQKAFTVLLKQEQEKDKLSVQKSDPWLVTEKEMIVADILFREAIESPNPFSQNEALKANEFFVDNIRRYILYELARCFYISAWLRIEEQNVQSTYLAGEAQSRLAQIYEALVTLSNTLGHQKRNTVFTTLFKSISQNHWETLKGLNNETGTTKLTEQIKKSLRQELLVFDPLFHFNTGRVKLGLAIEEILTGKDAKAMENLLVALTHFTMAEQLQIASTGSQEAILLNNALSDIYLRLHRLSLPR